MSTPMTYAELLASHAALERKVARMEHDFNELVKTMVLSYETTHDIVRAIEKINGVTVPLPPRPTLRLLGSDGDDPPPS